MLQRIRDKSSGWFSWVIIGIIVIVFALFGVSRYFSGSGYANTVATVNGQAISPNQVQAMYYQLQSYAQQKGFYSSTQRFADLLKKQALQDVIQTQALLQAANKSGFMLSPVVVQAAIEAVPEFKVNGRFSYQKWQQFVNTSPNADLFIQSVQDEQLLNQVQSGFVETGFTTPVELKQTQTIVDQERHLSFFIIPLSLFSMVTTGLSIEDQQRYYKRHANEFMAPELVRISYIELSLQALMANIKPTEQDLQGYYQDNSAQYQMPTKWQLQQLTIPVLGNDQGIDKKTLAVIEQFHQGQTIPASDGQVQTVWLSANDMGPDLQKVIANLKQVGQFSQPVHTADGYVMYKLLAAVPERQLSFNEVKGRVITAYKQQKAQAQFDNDSDQLANLTFSQPSTLIPAAKALGVAVVTTGYIGHQGGSDSITKDPNVLQVAFSHDVLINRNNSQVINVGNNAQVVIRVEDYKPASTKPFKEVQPQIQTLLRQQAQQQAARALADAISQALLKGVSPATLASEHHVEYKDLGFVNRRAKQHPQVIQAGFAMSVNQKTLVVPSNDHIDVIVLRGIQSGDAKSQAKDAQLLAQAVDMMEGQLAYQAYQDSVIKSAKIKMLN